MEEEIKMITLKLAEVLDNPEGIDWRHALYLPSNKETWNINVLALVMDPDDVDSDEPDADPEEVKKMGYMYVLTMQDVNSVVENIREQKNIISSEELYEALMFYYRNDAFIVV
ncbi:Uncharacterised protein [Serratia fonticola]|uniref:DUF7716 domain-containing protein n=1 Tax=Serratia fonticola TaxID=47917 RepID=UPI002183CDFD|nr:hypothetical protein [Serratia fonticola]CAI2160475.1 Uncharacterised protein [Serratia fonticola]